MGSSQSSQGSESSTSKKYTASGNGNTFVVEDKKSPNANQKADGKVDVQADVGLKK